MIEQQIDYFQYSLLVSEQDVRESSKKEINGFGFYSRGYENALGTRYYFGNPNSKKCLVVMSGRALHNRRAVGWDDRMTVGDALALQAKVSRIDWCVTQFITDDLVTVADVAKACESGKVDGTLAKRGWKQIAGADVGQPAGCETCYIGDPKRRGKDGIFRAYDKGLEMGIARDIITRLELEERGSNAHSSARRFIRGATVGSVFKSRLSFTDKRIDATFNASEIDMTRGKQIQSDGKDEKMDKRWEWLMSQVAPSLKEAMEYDRDNGLGLDRLDKFMRECGMLVLHDKPKEGKRER